MTAVVWVSDYSDVGQVTAVVWVSVTAVTWVSVTAVMWVSDCSDVGQVTAVVWVSDCSGASGHCVFKTPSGASYFNVVQATAGVITRRLTVQLLG